MRMIVPARLDRSRHRVEPRVVMVNAGLRRAANSAASGSRYPRHPAALTGSQQIPFINQYVTRRLCWHETGIKGAQSDLIIGGAKGDEDAENSFCRNRPDRG